MIDKHEKYRKHNENVRMGTFVINPAQFDRYKEAGYVRLLAECYVSLSVPSTSVKQSEKLINQINGKGW